MAPPDGGEGEVGVAAAPIKGGYDDATDTAVVDIVWMSGMGYSECSGSLLAPNLVLTAQHCVAQIKNGANGIDCSVASFGNADSPSNFYVSTKQFMSNDQADYHKVSEVITPETKSVCGNDVALLVLAENVAPEEAVPLVPRVDSEVATKDQYSAIGFGGTVDDGTGAGQRRRLDDLFVDCVGECDKFYVAVGKEWQGDHGICEGDSGGPAIDLQKRVIGVTSRGMSGCQSPVYGCVFGWGEWIKQQALHAAEVGGYEPLGWAKGYSTDPIYSYPVGEACSEPSACPSGACLGDPNGHYCTRACADNAPCPDGFECKAVSGAQYCQKPAPPPKPEQSSGCAVASADPAKPVPWAAGIGALAAVLAMARRRSRR
jgi:MYXO-CTERM domain-containing protein